VGQKKWVKISLFFIKFYMDLLCPMPCAGSSVTSPCLWVGLCWKSPID